MKRKYGKINKRYKEEQMDIIELKNTIIKTSLDGSTKD